jgi:hypothetical protein
MDGALSLSSSQAARVAACTGKIRGSAAGAVTLKLLLHALDHHVCLDDHMIAQVDLLVGVGVDFHADRLQRDRCQRFSLTLAGFDDFAQEGDPCLFACVFHGPWRALPF